MTMRIIIFIAFLFPSILRGLIVELSTFREIEQQIDANKSTVIASDIDNTLLRASQQLGSVSWGEHVKCQLISKGISKKNAQEICDIYWQAIQPSMKVECVDPETPNVIQRIQERKILLIGLTARHPHEIACTRNQLSSLGIDLKRAEDNFTCISLGNFEKLPTYHQGILYCTTHNKKSDVLFKFLDENKIYPQQLIFIDDKLHHVEEVAQACQSRNITYIGIRFRGADQYAKTFDRRIADTQWEIFPQYASDEEALHMIHQGH